MRNLQHQADTMFLVDTIRFDPLLRILIKVNLPILYMIISILYIFMILGLGSIISIYYEKRGFIFLSLFYESELIWCCFVYGLIIPIVWVTYIWQVKGYVQTLNNLIYEVLIPPQGFEIDEFIQKSLSKTNNRFFFVIPLSLTIVMLVIWSVLFTNTINNFTYNYYLVWVNINPFFYWFVWAPLTFISVYQVIWLVCRQVEIVISFSKLFEYCKTSPKLFHPDKCDGFSSIGNYAIRFSLLAVLFGIWVYLVIYLPIIFGGYVNIKLDTFIYAFVYIISVPISLIPPVWRTHKEMVTAKNKELKTIALQIQILMKTGYLDEFQTNYYLIEQLHNQYKIIEKGMKTWPFHPLSIKKFGISTITPIVSAIITFLYDYYFKILIH